MLTVMIEPRESGKSAVLFDGKELVVGRGGVVCAAARKLIDLGYDPNERLAACRSDVVCLSGPLKSFAELTVTESDRVSGPHFSKWRPFDRSTVEGP